VHFSTNERFKVSALTALMLYN